MRKLTAIFTFLLAFALIICAFTLSIFAETEGDTVLGEDNSTFKVTDADGNVTYYADGNYMDDVFATMKSGSTMTMLSDFSSPASGISFKPAADTELFFDFAGHTLSSEVKHSLFLLQVEGSTVHVYSSRPGAMFFGKDSSNNQGYCFMRTEGKETTGYLGTYGDYPGSNISIYLPAIVDNTSDSSSNIYVDGGNFYRNIGDWSGFFIVRQNGYVSVKNANIFGVTSSLNFNLAGLDGRIDVENCFLANLKDGGNICANLQSGSVISFTDCSFVDVVFNASSVGAETNDRAGGKITINGDCSYSNEPNFANCVQVNKTENFVRVYRPVQCEVAYNTYGSYPFSYEVLPHDEPVVALYAYATEDQFADIEWCFGDEIISEAWLYGETPINPFEIPEDTEFVRYELDEIKPVDGYEMYYINAYRNFDIYYNLNVYSNVDINVYIPAMADIEEASLGGTLYTSDAISKAPIVKIDGVDYRKLTKSGIRYDMLFTSYKLVLAIVGNDKMRTTFDSFADISVSGYVRNLMASELPDTDKAFVKEVVAYVKEVYAKLEKEFPAELENIA